MARSSRGSGRPLHERAFHRWLRATAKPTARGELGIGDDVASRAVRAGRLLLTTDAFAEGVHFWRESPPRLVGAALVEANLSDLASKGGTPIAFLLDLLVPPGTPERWARGIVLGAREALARYHLDLGGGDTKPAAGRTLVGTAVGIVEGRPLPGRDGARPGDLLVTTGTVGRGGVAALGRKRGGGAPDRNGMLRMIRARVAEGQRLAPYAHAMVDTSDGVFESARLLAESSQVGVELDEGALPFDPAIARAAPTLARQLEIAAYGGDYELLAAIPARSLAAATRSLRAVGCPLTRIGKVTSGRGNWIRTPTGWSSLPAAGWDPFRPALP